MSTTFLYCFSSFSFVLLLYKIQEDVCDGDAGLKGAIICIVFEVTEDNIARETMMNEKGKRVGPGESHVELQNLKID